MAEKVTKEEMAKILADNRHKELLSAIRRMQTSIGEIKVTDDIRAVINLNSNVATILTQIADHLSNIQTPIPSPSVTINQQEVVSAIRELSQQMTTALQQPLVDPPVREWEFEIIRDNFMRISSVKAKPKTDTT